MKRLLQIATPIIIGVLCSFSTLSPLHAQTQPNNGIEQALDFIITENGTKFIRWHAKTAHTYFIQISDPADHLGKWTYAPTIETGNDQEISFEVLGTAEKGFFRLHYTDQAIPPGKTVETADFDGDGLTNSQEIEPPFPLVGTSPLKWDTDGDGLSDGFERTYGFDPNNANPADPNQSPTGDPDNDGLTNLAEATLGTNPNDSNSDGDNFDDGQDADPNDSLVDWQAAPESSYVMIEVEGPLGFVPYPQDLNDKGEVLFPKHLWTAGTLQALPEPSFNGPAANNGEFYQSEHSSWNFINNTGRLLGAGNTSFPEPWQSDPDQETLFVHDPNPQGSNFNFTKNIPMWTYGNLTLQPIGLTEAGEVISEFHYATYAEVGDPPQEQETLFHKLVIFDADGAGGFSYLPMPNGYDPAFASYYPSTRVTPGGWIATLTAATSQSSGAAHKVTLWNPLRNPVNLPTQAEGSFEKINLTELPDQCVGLTAASGYNLQTQVFLINSAGAAQHAPKLSGKHLQTFAGDGTAMSSDDKLWRNGKLIPMRDLCQKFGELLDQGYQLFPLKGNKHGVYLIQAEGPSGEQKVFVASPIEIRGYATKQSEQVDSFIGTVNNQNVYEAHRVKIADSSDYTTFKTETKTKLKIAQWGAFDIFDDNLNFVDEKFKEDLDIFRVRLPDFPVPAGSVEHRIKISTKDKTWAVLDSGAEVDLNIVREDPADPNSPIKFHETAALALVADDDDDDDDDDFAVEGEQDGALGDRTYRAVLGGAVKVEWLTAPGNGPKPFIVIPVPAERVVAIQGFLLKGTTNNATVQGWYDCAKKIYSAAGVDLIFKDLIPIDPLPAGVNLGDDFDLPTETAEYLQEMQLETKALMDNPRCVVPQDTIPVFFVNKLNPDVAKGATNVPSYMVDGEGKYGGAIFINSDHQLKSVLAHELAHALLDAQHAPSTNTLWNDIFSDTREKTNVWWGKISPANGTWSETGINAHRRLTDSMRSRIWKSRFAKIPAP
jgi:hypothetical protein